MCFGGRCVFLFWACSVVVSWLSVVVAVVFVDGAALGVTLAVERVEEPPALFQTFLLSWSACWLF